MQPTCSTLWYSSWLAVFLNISGWPLSSTDCTGNSLRQRGLSWWRLCRVGSRVWGSVGQGVVGLGRRGCLARNLFLAGVVASVLRWSGGWVSTGSL